MPLNSAQRRAFGTAGRATPRLPSQRQTRHKQRTHDVLPKPDKLMSYRQSAPQATRFNANFLPPSLEASSPIRAMARSV